MHCLTCNKLLIGKQTHYCSKECKVFKYGRYKYQQKRGLDRKLELLRSKGNKCSICGYCKSMKALEFHHLDPGAKEFKLDTRGLSGASWKRILLEADKCILLCANCHREVHDSDCNTEIKSTV